MSRYKVELSNGVVANVPSDRARTAYESVRDYGLQAVLERARRTRAYQAAKKADESATIRVIICPDGEEVTQF